MIYILALFSIGALPFIQTALQAWIIGAAVACLIVRVWVGPMEIKQ